MRALRKAGAYMKGDERILGEGDFVQKILTQAEGSRKNNSAESALRTDHPMIERTYAMPPAE